jgi:hypothetical protein
LCASRTSWVIGGLNAGSRYPFLLAARVAYAGSDATLWRVETSVPAVSRALGCAIKPHLEPQDGPAAQGQDRPAQQAHAKTGRFGG